MPKWTIDATRAPLATLGVTAALIAAPLSSQVAQAQRTEGAPLAITNVTVIDGTDDPPRPGMTVIVRAGRIAVIVPAASATLPADARVVDATGKYLIPGLWDMHVHLGQWPESALALLVANGVTGVRDMGTSLTAVRQWRHDAETGKRIGPRIVAAGAILDGPGHPSPERVPLATPSDARRVVDSLAAAGADFIKVYEFLARDVFLAIADEARAKKLAIVGHVPRAVGAAAAAAAGQRSVEHLSGVPLSCPLSMRMASHAPGLSGVMPPCGDDRARADVFSHFKAAGTWVTPTLASFRGAARATDAAALGESVEPRMRYVTPELRRHWDEQIAKWPKLVPSGYRRGLADLFARLTRAAHAAGVPMLAGSDLGNTLVFAGSSLHDELELLVGAGLSPLEALQAATSGPARFLGIADSVGTVAVGKSADLVLLEADPLADIRNTRRIVAVIRAGALLDRAALDRLTRVTAAETAAP